MNLASERVNRGFTIRGLAREIGVAEQTLRRLENGEVVHPAKAKLVADYFGCKVTDLMPLGGDGSAAS
jgi:transcriptional regulator with XRE-family HTH domain